MANILTAAEGANFVRTTSDDAILTQLLPLVDQYLFNASGHDWTADTTKHPTAKIAAGMLITYWYDNPSSIGQPPEALSAILTQLEAEALKYRKYVFTGLNGAGSIWLNSAREGDVVITLTGVAGLSGDQSALFEAVVSEDFQISQTSSADLSESQFVVVLKHPAEDVKA